MTTSGIEEMSMRLLEAFHDLSRGRLEEPVTLKDEETSGRETAAARAGLDPLSTDPAVAIRYLLNQGYVEPTGTVGAYAITVPGMDLIRQRRGLDSPPNERSRMSDKTQRQLITILSILLSMVLTKPMTKFIDRQIPERRGIKDDLTEALLQGAVRAAALFGATFLVRTLVAR